MTKKSDDIRTLRRNKQLYASIRFVVAIILQLWIIYYFTHAGALGGADAVNDTLKEFLFIFIPTITILFLLPLVIRGSFSQKIISIILLIFPVWIAFYGWMTVIAELFK
jgi:hypothetical protein